MLKAQIESASAVSSDWEHRSVSLFDIRRLLKDE
jgi:hypothetical protein